MLTVVFFILKSSNIYIIIYYSVIYVILYYINILLKMFITDHNGSQK